MAQPCLRPRVLRRKIAFRADHVVAQAAASRFVDALGDARLPIHEHVEIVGIEHEKARSGDRGQRKVAYRSQFLSVYDRGHAGQAKIKARLIGDDLDPDLPPKPKWMRWRTYDRLVERFDAYEDMTYPDDFALVAKLMRRFNSPASAPPGPGAPRRGPRAWSRGSPRGGSRTSPLRPGPSRSRPGG